MIMLFYIALFLSELKALYTNITPGRPVDTAYLFFFLSHFLSLSLPLSLAISAPWGVLQETQANKVSIFKLPQ